MISKISELLKEKKVDGALVSSPANIRYLSRLCGTERLSVPDSGAESDSDGQPLYPAGGRGRKRM